jgi:hypothetical protein
MTHGLSGARCKTQDPSRLEALVSKLQIPNSIFQLPSLLSASWIGMTENVESLTSDWLSATALQTSVL